MNINKRTRSLTFLGVIIAIQMVMTFTNLGFIPLGILNATLLHIPVIVGAIFLGPIGGSVLGLVFGILSVVMATIQPNATSFVFSPFYSVDGNSGNMWSLVIAIVPRVLIGITSYYTYYFLNNFDKHKVFSYSIVVVMTGVISYFSYNITAGANENIASWLPYLVAAVVLIMMIVIIYIVRTKLKNNKIIAYGGAGIVGSATNTILVMVLIYTFFGDTGDYANITQNGIGAVFKAISAVIFTYGIAEAVVAAVIVTAIGGALRKVFKSDLMLNS